MLVLNRVLLLVLACSTIILTEEMTHKADMECEEDDIHSIVIRCVGSSTLVVFSHCSRKSVSFMRKKGEPPVVLKPESDKQEWLLQRITLIVKCMNIMNNV